MTQLDWTEWAAIYLAGYNDARGAANPMTPEDLSLAWEGYRIKRPMLTDKHPNYPQDHTATCPRKDETHAFCPVAQHTRRVRTSEERAMVGDSRPVTICIECGMIPEQHKMDCSRRPGYPEIPWKRCHSCPMRHDTFCHIQCTGD